MFSFYQDRRKESLRTKHQKVGQNNNAAIRSQYLSIRVSTLSKSKNEPLPKRKGKTNWKKGREQRNFSYPSSRQRVAHFHMTDENESVVSALELSIAELGLCPFDLLRSIHLSIVHSARRRRPSMNWNLKEPMGKRGTFWHRDSTHWLTNRTIYRRINNLATTALNTLHFQ